MLGPNVKRMITLYHVTGSLYNLWYGSHSILLIWVTLVTMDHPVSYDYGSLCILWLWITMYSLTNDHLVSTDNGPSSIQGCQVFQLKVFLVNRVWQFQVAQQLRWVGWGTILITMPLCGPILSTHSPDYNTTYAILVSNMSRLIVPM